ncbi:uncharacterized protein ASPGLDRAFT_1092793 [Aspergillus glaucus CBS 516.65]|uniref:Uncharacterized protein n=1 Tax=Aspergillus glaucus CBS 516.65 TaxID=1160497 RepID=A0A1L9V4N3_ASPGL|nr:hypothetical protein ASPGLDRAFT_1092793 [Aspergillus glaucus CBS 516.65]OJJ78894.1 hypothetical protein ASPGLDRAFT_1092793 [Aspergillus glaucus CBS 516.65]
MQCTSHMQGIPRRRAPDALDRTRRRRAYFHYSPSFVSLTMYQSYMSKLVLHKCDTFDPMCKTIEYEKRSSCGTSKMIVPAIKVFGPVVPILRQIQTQPQIRPTLQARSWAEATLKTSYTNTRSWLKRDGLHTRYSLQTLHPSNLYHNILTRTKLTLTGGLSILFRALTPPSICSSSSSSPYLEAILCQSFTFYCCIGLVFLCLPFDLS